MKRVEQIAKMAKVSKPVIYKRVGRIDNLKPENHIYTYQKFDGKMKRVWTDEEVQEILAERLPIGCPKKVYSED